MKDDTGVATFEWTKNISPFALTLENNPIN